MLCYSSISATITWNGTTGNWNNASKWTGGVVPTATDVVYIPSGSVTIPAGYHAVGRTVSVGPAGRLTIRQGSSLSVGEASGVNGVYNEGSVFVNGDLNILDLGDWYSFGIRNKDTLSISGTGRITIGNTILNGIWNEAYVSNNGAITIDEAYYAVRLLGAASWTNGANASLTISNADWWGIHTDTNSVFTNRGLIDITGTGQHAILNYGNFINELPGNIQCSDGELEAISVYGTFENKSLVELTDNYYGIRNGYGYNGHGTFLNRSNGRIHISGSLIGINNTAYAIAFKNWGVITLQNISNTGINNQDDNFRNEACGLIETSAYILVGDTAVFYNYGWIKNMSTQNSLNFGSFQNHGVIEDNPLTMSGAVANYRLIVRPVPGPLVQSVPVPNFLNTAAWSQHAVLGVYTDAAATQAAGTFSQTTNTFTPSQAGAGLPVLYIKIWRNGGNCAEIFRIDVQNPAPLTPPGAGFSFSNTTPDESFLLYPNPADGPVMLRTGAGENGLYELQALDAMGKMVLRREMELVPGMVLPFGPPQEFTPGLYFVQVMKSGSRVWQGKLVVLKMR